MSISEVNGRAARSHSGASSTSPPSTASFLPHHHHPQQSRPRTTKPLDSSTGPRTSPAAPTSRTRHASITSLPPGVAAGSSGQSPTDALFSPPSPLLTRIHPPYGQKQLYVLDDRSRLRLILSGILVITLLMSVPILVTHFENIRQ
ncbi:hypothetical protein BJ684DRAFT_21098 [Piptocephalis cylindrospora]|uniref:Uncharacterized protein n=1 Tax=Piptocephalis cylindrospora TaxID=1907219 RepID=A0A4P9Y0S0_9FUNG|nr:hypothetical protein BJ684DRAFT_21098 [Piptocephalis cylindrospora]|eukprot:RKP12353.1 hypothetical protein BJ684DRAFT_21098 [Piptocephalis cylindrospora]